MEGWPIIESHATPDQLPTQLIRSLIEVITVLAFTWKELRKRTKIPVREPTSSPRYDLQSGKLELDRRLRSISQ
jgi:hypothetical protein